MVCCRPVSVNTTRLLAGEPGFALSDLILGVPITSPDPRLYGQMDRGLDVVALQEIYPAYRPELIFGNAAENLFLIESY